MAKKRRIERERNRQKLVKKHFPSRIYIIHELTRNTSLERRLEFHSKLQLFPRNSVPSRLCNRCRLSGRSRGYYRDFSLSRHFLRRLAREGFLPGLQKSSW
jgi:small subunit ribosomal protein S14